MVISSGNRELN